MAMAHHFCSIGLRLALLCLALWGVALGWPAHAARPAVLVRFSHVVAPDTPKGQMAQHFQQLVQQRSGGRIRVEVYPDSQLYGDDDEMEALRLGAVELLAPSLSKFGNVGMPEFEVFDLPFLFTDLAQVRRVLQGPVGQQLRQRLARQQMLGLGFMVPVLLEFFATGLVPRFPTLIMSGVLLTLAMLMLVCGLILDTVAKKHRQLFEVNLNLLRLLHEREPKA